MYNLCSWNDFFFSILGVFYITLPETSPQDRRRGDSNIHQNLAHKAHSQQTSLSSSTRSIVILQSSERPPHFFLQLDGKERVEISAGRNNLFHTLLFFLYHIKSKESGQLGRINLGISGVNMLWVINNPNWKWGFFKTLSAQWLWKVRLQSCTLKWQCKAMKNKDCCHHSCKNLWQILVAFYSAILWALSFKRYAIWKCYFLVKWSKWPSVTSIDHLISCCFCNHDVVLQSVRVFALFYFIWSATYRICVFPDYCIWLHWHFPPCR